ncbi:hypothetical protein G4O51_01415 [Candidatus Bathyarchaeota archaeon A05DMB-2]|jgi:parallel beta-helix repeat protein|nr:hypothetical protein [Candidatus Bathyarchaeota archaeon A05DMB-2]
MKLLAAVTIMLLVFCFLAGMPFVMHASANPVLMPPEIPQGIQIKSDGSVEGTDKLHRDGNIYTFTGDISNTIVILCDGIVLDGAGYTLRGSGDGSGVFIQERNNVVIRNLKISNFRCGVLFTWGSYDSAKTLRSNKISGNTISNNTYGVLFSDFSVGNEVSGNHIIGNCFGVSISGSSNNVFRNNSFESNQYAIKDDSHYPHDIDTSNTVNGKPIYYWVDQHGKTVPSDAGCVVLKNCSGITVRNLNLEGSYHGIFLCYTDNSTISGNVVTNNWEGITLKCSSNNIVSGNQVISNNEGGITVEYSSNNIISGNRVESNGWGISIGDYSNNNVVSKNEVVANANHGVNFGYHSTGNAVTANLIVENGGNGIFFSTIQDSKVTGNNVTLNKGCGIGFGYGPNGVIKQNYISKNRVGIWISNAEANTITFNTVTENTAWGIELEGSHKNNVIHHNNFINNAGGQGTQVRIAEVWVYPGLNKPHRPGEQVEPPRLVAGAANVWNDGKEGNYWSDYKIRYPNSSEVGNTGVGDTLYFINENNVDHYPLMSPLEISVDLPSLQPPSSFPPSPQPSQEPIPTQSAGSQTEQAPFPTALFIIFAASSVTIGLGLILHFMKRRHSTQLQLNLPLKNEGGTHSERQSFLDYL